MTAELKDSQLCIVSTNIAEAALQSQTSSLKQSSALRMPIRYDDLYWILS